MISYKISLIAIFSIIILFSVQYASAEIQYPTTFFRLDSSPIFCIIIPNDSKVEDEKKQKWIELAQNALDEWQTKLQNVESKNKELWTITNITISEEESELFDCTITIDFKEKPSLVSKNIVGTFFYPPGKIEIYYLQIMTCDVYSYCYKDGYYRTNNSIYTTLLHEIGHAFGLDHYESTNNKTNISWRVYVPSPSIMIPSQHADPKKQTITELDLEMVRSLYNNGFGEPAQIEQPIQESVVIPIHSPKVEEQPISIPTIPSLPKTEPMPIILEEKPIPESISIAPLEFFELSEHAIKVGRLGPQVVTISGKILNDEYHRGMPLVVSIHQPDNSVETFKITTTGNGFFQTPLMFDASYDTGVYDISISYHKHTNQYVGINFEISK